MTYPASEGTSSASIVEIQDLYILVYLDNIQQTKRLYFSETLAKDYYNPAI